MKVYMKYILLLCTLMLSACNGIKTAIYDQYSYQQEVILKVTTKNILDQATNPYEDYKNEIAILLLEMEKMEEYEKNKPHNELSYQMWQLMTDTDKNNVAGLFKYWEEKGKLSPVFVSEATDQVMEAFDILIQYEVSKDKKREHILLEFLANN